MARIDQKRLTFDDFLDWERNQEFKHALVDGEPIRRADATVAHSAIQANLIAAAALERDRLRLNSQRA